MSKVLVAIHLLRVFHGLPESFGANLTVTLESGASLERVSFNEFNACQEFRAENTVGSGWLLEDCIDVWTSWARTAENAAVSHNVDRQFFFDVSDRLRRQGTPCYVEAPKESDGAGSSTLRSLATWVFAEEMGCDYLLPARYWSGNNTDGFLYCHHSNHIKEEDQRCAAVDWIAYLNTSDHMKPFPDDGQSTKPLDVTHGMSSLQKSTSQFLKYGGFEHPPWVHWILKTGNPVPSGSYFITPETWNAGKLQRIRDLLERMRTSFRWYPRPSYPAEQDCKFEASRTNIAIHVRLGDRDNHKMFNSKRGTPQMNHNDYLDKLEDVMDTISEAVVRQGEALPIFHIFSETSVPCPPKETGAFHEFLRWPVETQQIEPCLAAVTPGECWEKTQGARTCPSPRSGVFRVQEKPLYLHVGLDVENAMSCMIKADGILMGCSTFGQVAGLYSEGVRFFSIACEGWLTAPQYKMMPPMAIAERGSMWVPVSGSWRDPVVYSERILDAALSQLYTRSKNTQHEG